MSAKSSFILLNLCIFLTSTSSFGVSTSLIRVSNGLGFGHDANIVSPLGGFSNFIELNSHDERDISYGYEGDSGLCHRSGQYVRPSRSCLVFARWSNSG